MDGLHLGAIMRILFLLIVFTTQTLLGQTKELEALLKAHESAAETIILYPEEIWESALMVATRVDAIEKIQELQEWSEAKFRKAVSPFSRMEQERFWNISRYPELVDDLIQLGRRQKRRWKKILNKYPEEIREDALHVASEHFSVLIEMQKIHRRFVRDYSAYIVCYPKSYQRAMDAIISHPEVFSLMVLHMELTKKVGWYFRKNPHKAIVYARKYQLQVAKKLARARRDWEADLKEDPKAMKDLKLAAEIFADEQGLSKQVVPELNRHISVQLRPYPLWCGVPSWHVEAHWYPYPCWYHWGFYVSRGGNEVVFNLPSIHFAMWQFRKAKHYPHLARIFLRQYSCHPSVRSGCLEGTRRYVTNNRIQRPRSWLKQHERRIRPGSRG